VLLDRELLLAATLTYYVGIGIAVIVGGMLCIVPVAALFWAEIEANVTKPSQDANTVVDPVLKTLLDKTKFLNQNIKSQVASNAIFCVLFSTVPLLRNNATYQVGVAFAGLGVGAHALLAVFRFHQRALPASAKSSTSHLRRAAAGTSTRGAPSRKVLAADAKPSEMARDGGAGRDAHSLSSSVAGPAPSDAAPSALSAASVASIAASPAD
jgi:hypothetical protein